MEISGALYKNIADDTLIKTGAGKVYGVVVNSHTSGKMILVNGTTAYNETADAATGSLTFTGVVADGQTVTIGSEVYEFDTDSDVTAGNIAVDVSGGVTAAAAVTALVTAITAESALVTAVDDTGDVVTVTATTAGVAGNSIATTETCTNASWGAATLTGGLDANTKILNTYTFASGSQVITFPEPINFVTGLYVDLDSSTADLTVLYN